ncbi:MAG TPA: NAD(P)/FAD-dependent oxidoreductase [Polyangia bacterium]|jgi:NADH dehydrogenase
MMRPHVIILGAGFGGLRAVRGLSRMPVAVTLVDRSNHHTFQPLLYQVATAALATTDVAFPLRSLLRRQKNVAVLMAEARAIDAAARLVHFIDGPALPYDYLILATGAEPSYYGHPEYRHNAPGLKSISDAIEMRYRVLVAFERAEQADDPDEQRALMTFVVVGGGPTGVELAGAVAELARHALARDFRRIDPTKARVVLVEGGPTLLASYPPELQASAVKQLVGLGVEVRLRDPVRAVDEAGVTLHGEAIAARTVLWGAGVVATPLGRTLGVPVDGHGRVEVDARLHPPGLPEVFVIGDAATRLQDGAPLPGVAPTAIQGGHYAARAIVAGLRGQTVAPFHYHFKGELSTIGRSRAVARLPRGIELSGFTAWVLYLSVHLFYLIGFRRRVRAFSSWVWSYLTWSRGARLIPDVPPARQLRELAYEAHRSDED